MRKREQDELLCLAMWWTRYLQKPHLECKTTTGKNKTTLLNKMVETEPGRWLTGRESRALVSTPAQGMHEYCCNLTSNTTTNPSKWISVTVRRKQNSTSCSKTTGGEVRPRPSETEHNRQKPYKWDCRNKSKCISSHNEIKLKFQRGITGCELKQNHPVLCGLSEYIGTWKDWPEEHR